MDHNQEFLDFILSQEKPSINLGGTSLNFHNLDLIIAILNKKGHIEITGADFTNGVLLGLEMGQNLAQNAD